MRENWKWLALGAGATLMVGLVFAAAVLVGVLIGRGSSGTEQESALPTIITPQTSITEQAIEIESPTATSTPNPTATPTPAPTPTPTPEATLAPTMTSTPSPVPTEEPTPELTPEITPTPTPDPPPPTPEPTAEPAVEEPSPRHIIAQPRDGWITLTSPDDSRSIKHPPDWWEGANSEQHLVIATDMVCGSCRIWPDNLLAIALNPSEATQPPPDSVPIRLGPDAVDAYMGVYHSDRTSVTIRWDANGQTWELSGMMPLSYNESDHYYSLFLNVFGTLQFSGTMN